MNFETLLKEIDKHKRCIIHNAMIKDYFNEQSIADTLKEWAWFASLTNKRIHNHFVFSTLEERLLILEQAFQALNLSSKHKLSLVAEETQPISSLLKAPEVMRAISEGTQVNIPVIITGFENRLALTDDSSFISRYGHDWCQDIGGSAEVQEALDESQSKLFLFTCIDSNSPHLRKALVSVAGASQFNPGKIATFSVVEP